MRMALKDSTKGEVKKSTEREEYNPQSIGR